MRETLDQALKGIRVADLTIITAGASATQMLADLGAEIIKVESGPYPDPFRYWASPAGSDTEPPPDPWNWAPSFNMVNRNKQGVCLDMKHPKGRETFLKLVEVSDMVTENFRQGVMDRLGIGYETLRQVNPKIIMLSLGSQGSTGPESRYGSYGSTLDALSGLMGITGYTDSHPLWSSGEVNYPDQVASMFGAGILLAAIRHRDRTGQGTYIDLSQREMVTTMIGEHMLEYTVEGRMPVQQGNRHPTLAPNDCYRCAGDNDWVAISVGGNDEWRALCQTIGQPDLIDDERYRTPQARSANQASLRPTIEAWTSTRSKREAMDALQAAGVRAGAVLTGADMLQDPHLNARGYYQPVENIRSGHQTLRIAPYKLSRTPPTVQRPAPTLGQDTESVLRNVLGMSDEQIQELADLGVTTNAARSTRARVKQPAK
ncbi:MAG TPA: CoA transferase [Thermomicrobiales bacterium]|nr:CoA transferase [Thermomicrobiales bacterium]